jgi:hypothetical protein
MSNPQVQLRWTPPPGWPIPPVGWEPPQGWTPPQEWGPAPAGWQWWQPVQVEPRRQSALSFHLTGAGVLVFTLIAYHVALWCSLVITAACGDHLGSPAAQHALFVIFSGLLLLMSAVWVWRGFRQHRAWAPWLLAIGICGLFIVEASRWGWQIIENGCLF